MVPRENPYDGTVSVPRISLPRRELVERAARVLLAGQGCVLLGGMGMGKSVALHQLRAHLTRPEVTVLLLRGIPSRTPTVTAVLNALARRLGLPESADPDAGELFGRYLEEHGEVQALVLAGALPGGVPRGDPGRGGAARAPPARRALRGARAEDGGSPAAGAARVVAGYSPSSSTTSQPVR